MIVAGLAIYRCLCIQAASLLAAFSSPPATENRFAHDDQTRGYEKQEASHASSGGLVWYVFGEIRE